MTRREVLVPQDSSGPGYLDRVEVVTGAGSADQAWGRMLAHQRSCTDCLLRKNGTSCAVGVDLLLNARAVQREATS
ncbi:hypothetical protein QR77_21260 [Streptomyces sp. 150FB]|uniref:hypothetical protein n=1 Tax=Streptomyces sp. 150FB TaxID=1576605 RepID=UPI0005893AE6|nr:hypothetical protein [Streptomyces sp. 150FB]KIF75731.1 hypothetical protein QR77_21260 [Streptomyces sp. 150FB]